MRKAKRTILIVMLICVVTVPFRSAEAARSKDTLKHPTALELLDRFGQTHDKIRSSFISKAEQTAKWRADIRSRPAIKKGVEYYSHRKVEFRSDGDKLFTFAKHWGFAPGRGPVSEENASHVHRLWDGESDYNYKYSPATPRGAKTENGLLVVQRKKDVPVLGHSLSNAPGGPLRGEFLGSDERIDAELKQQSATMSVQPEMEEINGSQCYVINAKTKGCEYKLWIDPGHDYHVVKAIIKRDWTSAGRPEKYRNPPPQGTNSLYLKNVRFKKYDDAWVPIECDHGYHIRFADGGYEKGDSHHKMTDFVINPDHDALGSFECDFVRNGAMVRISNIKGSTYTWEDGKVVDKEGNVVLDCTAKTTSDSPESEPRSPMKKRPGIWELVSKHAAQEPVVANPVLAERVVRFPADRSLGNLTIQDENAMRKIGRCFVVEPQSQPLWHTVLVWPKTDVGWAASDVNVPAGKIFRLDVWDGGPRSHRALAALGASDVQILSFYQCKKADDRMLSAASGLTGLKVLFLGEGRFTLKGLKHLTAFRELQALQIPGDVPVETLELIRKLTALRYLNIGGPELTDAKMAKVGQLPWLTQLSIGAHDRSEGLRHIARLKSLQYLNLAAVRDPQLDRHLAYIADLIQLEELDCGDSMIGDTGLQHLKGMIKLKKLDIGNRYYPVSYKITDAGMVHLNNLKSLEELTLPSAGINDIGLARLAGLSTLKKLNVGRDVTDEGMAALARMKSLEDLDLGCPNITDAGLAELCRGSSLKSLSIGRCKVTDAGLANVANYKSLERLSVSNVPINGAGLAAMKQCPSLRGISLSFVELQNNAITYVAAIPSLETLRLYRIGTAITDESLNQLSMLTNLKTLSIVMKETSQMPITDVGIEHLLRLKKLEYVSLSHCEKITDKGLKHFEGLASLRQLRLDKSRVTKAGVDRLKEKIPGLSVTVPATMRPVGSMTPANPATRTGRGNSTIRTTERRR